MSKDPWEGDDLRSLRQNGWSYVEGNPVNLTDPTGFVSQPTYPTQCKRPLCVIKRIVAKSYIALVGNRIGTVPGGNQTALKLLASVTDSYFNENPTSTRKNKGYRLFSEIGFRVCCLDNEIVSVRSSNLILDTGTEPANGPFVFQAPSGIPWGEYGFMGTITGRYRFGWAMKSAPHFIPNLNLHLVKPRRSIYIWHEVDGSIFCKNDRVYFNVNIKGSRFPSHRLWGDSSASPKTIRQGVLSNLWVGSSTDPTLVR